MTGLPSDSGSTAAWLRLADRLTEAAAGGRAAPCCVDPEPFTSERREDRAGAAAACTACPGRLECARFALASDARAWVWAGVDLTPERNGTVPPAAARALLREAATR